MTVVFLLGSLDVAASDATMLYSPTARLSNLYLPLALPGQIESQSFKQCIMKVPFHRRFHHSFRNDKIGKSISRVSGFARNRKIWLTFNPCAFRTRILSAVIAVPNLIEAEDLRKKKSGGEDATLAGKWRKLYCPVTSLVEKEYRVDMILDAGRYDLASHAQFQVLTCVIAE